MAETLQPSGLQGIEGMNERNKADDIEWRSGNMGRLNRKNECREYVSIMLIISE